MSGSQVALRSTAAVSSGLSASLAQSSRSRLAIRSPVGLHDRQNSHRYSSAHTRLTDHYRAQNREPSRNPALGRIAALALDTSPRIERTVCCGCATQTPPLTTVPKSWSGRRDRMMPSESRYPASPIDTPVSASDTAQSLAATARSRACGATSAGAGAPRSSPQPFGP